MEKRRGKLIVIEGIGHAGKSEQVKRLETRLREAGYPIQRGREPGGSFVGEAIRDLLIAPKFKSFMRPLTSVFLFNAARYQFIYDDVQPALANGINFVTDRSFLSTLAYQVHGEGVDREIALRMCIAALAGTMPDHIFLLNITLIAMEERARRSDNTKKDRYDQENMAFQRRVLDGYLFEAQKFSPMVEVIDGERPIETIAEELFQKTIVVINA